MNGVGSRRLGNICWAALPEATKLVGNSYVVVARKAIEDIASVERLVCSALLFAFVVDFA